MQEPDWSRLPFATTPAEWFAYTEQATAADAAALIQGQTPAAPVVELHRPAVAAFARECGVTEAEAQVEIGTGVLRWSRVARPHDGQCYRVRFRGAAGVDFHVGRLGAFLMVHLPSGGKGSYAPAL
jgi:hypothetical protein